MDSFAAQQVKKDIINCADGQVKPGSFEADVKDFIDTSYPINERATLSEIGVKSNPELYQTRLQDALQELSESTPLMSDSVGASGSIDQPFKTMEDLALKYGDAYRKDY